jgi:hypothetical protein
MSRNKYVWIFSIVAFMLFFAGKNEIKSPFNFLKNSHGIEIREHGKPVFFYQGRVGAVNSKNTFNNYLHPLYSLNGDTLTDVFPADHPYHKGVFWAWHQVYVGGKSVGDGWIMQDLEQEVVNVKTKIEKGNGMFILDADWKSPLYENRKAFLNEHTMITVHPLRNNIRMIDFTIRLIAKVPDVEIGGSDDEKGYGGFCARLKRPPEIIFTSEKGKVTAQNTQITAGPWMDFSVAAGPKGERSGFTILCHPKTPNYPAPWILRSETSMQNIVFPGRKRIQLSMKDPIILHYRVLIHNASEKIDIPKLQKEYEQVVY